MKEETKIKLKKVAKVGGYALGLAALFILGLGAGYCSAQKSAEQPKASVKAFYADDVESYNLVDYAIGSYSMYCGQLPEGDNTIKGYSAFRTYLFDSSVIKAGHMYVFTFDGSGSSAYGNYYMGGISDYCKSCVQNGTAFEGFADDFVHWVAQIGNSSHAPVAFNVTNVCYSTFGEGYEIYNRSTFSICVYGSITGLYLADDSSWVNKAPSVSDIRFSENSWFPYQLLGSNNSPVVLGPVHSSLSHRTIVLDDLLFSSNGRLFNGLSFIFAPLAQTGSAGSLQHSAPSAYGYLNDDGSWASYQGVDSDDLWFLSQVSYIPVDGGSYVIVGGQRLRVYSDYSMAVTQYFDWVDNSFSRVSVKWAGPSINTDVSTSSLTSFEWLKAVASSVFDDSIIVGGGGMMDVFTMVGSGFSAVAALLNVQVLPFLTLGTLLLAPLVVILALAIIKVLNK